MSCEDVYGVRVIWTVLLLWIVTKVHGRFGNEEDPLLRNAVKDVYERSTQKLFVMLREKSAAMLPDGDSFLFCFPIVLRLTGRCAVLEDYIRMLMNMVEFAPDIFFESSTFLAAFRIALAALTLIHTDTVFASLDLIRMILTHDCLSPEPLEHPPPKFPLYANAFARPSTKRVSSSLASL